MNKTDNPSFIPPRHFLPGRGEGDQPGCIIPEMGMGQMTCMRRKPKAWHVLITSIKYSAGTYRPLEGAVLSNTLNTGMRQGEILDLEWSQVDLFRKTATIMRTKNGERRTLPLNQSAIEVLKSRSKVRHLKSNYVGSSRKSVGHFRSL